MAGGRIRAERVGTRDSAGRSADVSADASAEAPAEAPAETTPRFSALETTLLALLAILVLSGLTIAGRFWSQVMHSDQLYPIALYRDLFVDGYGLSHWRLQPATSAFPNLPIFFGLLSITPDDGIALVLWAIVLSLALVALLTWIIHPFCRSRSRALLGAVAVLAVIVAGNQDQADRWQFQYFFSPSFHSSAVLNGLVLIGLVMHAVRHGWSRLRLGLFFVFTFLGLVSDPVILTQFVLPLGAALLVLAVRGFVSWRFLLAPAALTAASLVLSIATKFALRSLADIRIPSAFSLHKISFAPDRLGAFAHDLASSYAVHPWPAAGLVLWIALLIARRFRPAARGSEGSRVIAERLAPDDAGVQTTLSSLLDVTFVVSILASAAAPVVLGLWGGEHCTRYLATVTLFPILALVIHLSRATSNGGRRIRLAAFSLVALWSLAAVVRSYPEFQWSSLRFPYPPEVRFVDALCREHGLQYGYSDYWLAKRVTFCSRADVRVNQLDEKLDRYRWITNLSWYERGPKRGSGLDPHGPLQHRFIITQNLSRERILAELGPPALVREGEGIEVFIYDHIDPR